MKLVVVGGSSPFTLGLIQAIAASGYRQVAGELVLQGRNTDALQLVAQHSKYALKGFGWRVTATTELNECLDGATIVIHQNRYGGMHGRIADELFAEQYGVAADETLGPAGLLAALRSAEPVRRMAAMLQRHCPNAWIINLTNPLSVTTAMLASAGLRKCVGLCELPLITARLACQYLGVPVDDACWKYWGLNHRGFIYHFSVNGRDSIGALAGSLGKTTLNGISAETIHDLHAIPLKYYCLFQGSTCQPGGRAQSLQTLRDKILDELRADPQQVPRSLGDRSMPWYPDAVLPLLSAIAAGTGSELIINVPCAEGYVVECPAKVFADGYVASPAPALSGAVGSWAERFVRHEKAVMECVDEPTFDSIYAALELDPIVPGHSLRPLAMAVLQRSSSDVMCPL